MSYNSIKKHQRNLEIQTLLIGKLFVNYLKIIDNIDSLSDVEFKVFSQFGDDGIIQWLINKLQIPNETFIEFGVEDYQESNTRFLLMNNNWSGLVIDSSNSNIQRIKKSEYFWKHELTAINDFITAENINELIASVKFNADIGILHIDLDGNDYWIWRAINTINPIVVILEYNSLFGIDRKITIPYEKKFVREKAHFSNLYFGSSLSALYDLSRQKGYSFIGCNSAGNNAYFIRDEMLNEYVKPISLEKGFVASKVRECRDKNGKLSYLSGNDRLLKIKGLPVYNIDTKRIEKI
ncbi:hypothetical protein JCM12296A_34870 [Desulfosarcina cetonica]